MAKQKLVNVKKIKTSSNDELVGMLLEIGNYEKNTNRQFYKFNAYRKAAESIRNLPHKLTDADEAKNLTGVGKKILEKVKQYLDTGEIDEIKKIRGDQNAKSLQELTRVRGIGPAAAQKLVKIGINSIEDLRAHEDKLNHAQKIGLRYVDDFEQPIPRKEMEFLTKKIKSLDQQFVVTVCGSFRRGAEASEDVDVLLAHPNYVSTVHEKEKKSKKPGSKVDSKKMSKRLIEKVVHELVKQDFIKDTISFGESRFMGVCRLNEQSAHREFNMRLIPYDQYYCGLLYFTGSDMFNKFMRKKALEAGYTLNEYSLRQLNARGIPGKVMDVNSEVDVFNHIGMTYKKPEERNMV